MSGPSILIIKPSSLGDIVHGLLTARMIKQGLPEAVIHWVSRDIFAPVVWACPVVDKVLLFHRGAGPRAFYELIREIRKQRYDYVLDFQGLARTGLLTLLARATLKVGRSDAREGSKLCYARRVPLPAAGPTAHAVDILAEFLPVLGLPRSVAPGLPMRLPKVNMTDGASKAPIVLFPESRRPEKNWPHFPELTHRLCLEHPKSSVLWAGSAAVECPQAESLANFTNLTAKTSLPELMALLSQARLVIGNDSGPLHLAAALGAPTLALFGPTNPDQYRPYPGDDHQNHVLQAPGGRFCALSSQAVQDKIQDILSIAGLF